MNEGRNVNLQSVDAMFATLIAEQKSNHAAVMTRLGGQDEVLLDIRTQARATNGRVTELEKNELVRRVKFGTAAFIFSGIGSLMAWCIQILVG